MAAALLCAGRATAADAPAPDRECVEHGGYAVVLQATVRGAGVDYPLLRARHLPALGTYLAQVAKCDAAALSRSELLALYLNLYNATVLHAVAGRYESGYSVSRDSFALFDEPLVSLGGQSMSLNRLEKRIIRSGFPDPRIHAALVCAARSCPPLGAEPYRAANLDQTLAERMRQFVGDPARNRIDATGRRLELSQVFSWYAADFGGSDHIAEYIDGFTEADVFGFSVSFLEYSWELNLAANPESPIGPGGLTGPREAHTMGGFACGPPPGWRPPSP